jgi:hypothetical protein
MVLGVILSTPLWPTSAWPISSPLRYQFPALSPYRFGDGPLGGVVVAVYPTFKDFSKGANLDPFGYIQVLFIQNGMGSGKNFLGAGFSVVHKILSPYLAYIVINAVFPEPDLNAASRATQMVRRYKLLNTATVRMRLITKNLVIILSLLNPSPIGVVCCCRFRPHPLNVINPVKIGLQVLFSGLNAYVKQFLAQTNQAGLFRCHCLFGGLDRILVSDGSEIGAIKTGLKPVAVFPATNRTWSTVFLCLSALLKPLACLFARFGLTTLGIAYNFFTGFRFIDWHSLLHPANCTLLFPALFAGVFHFKFNHCIGIRVGLIEVIVNLILVNNQTFREISIFEGYVSILDRGFFGSVPPGDPGFDGFDFGGRKLLCVT